MKKQYNAIDILKLIFAICIVAIHTNIMSSEESNVQWVIMHGFFRLAVPFFFVCSGFFLGLKLYSVNDYNEGINKIKDFCKRLLIPFIFWMIIGLPIQIYRYRSDSLIKIIIKIIRGMLFYPWGALWYIMALIAAIIIIMPFYKKNKIEYAMIVGGILYLFALICNNYYFAIENTIIHKFIDLYLKICVSARNGVFVGLYFVSSGIFIAKNITNKKKFNKTLHIPVLIISYLTLITEILLIKNYTHKDDHALFIMFLILIPEIVNCCININSKIDTKILRNYSTGIYFIHSPLKYSILAATSLLGISINDCGLFISVLSIAIIILTILYKVDNKYINKVIK